MEPRKRINQGKVEIDFEESALIVHFEVEMVIKDEYGRVVEVTDKRSDAKRIKIKNLSAERDLAQLASDIVDKCKYIHPSRVEEIEQLLIRLRKHALSNGGGSNNGGGNSNPNGDYPNDVRENIRETKLSVDTSNARKNEEKREEKKPARSREKEEDSLPEASMTELDDYLEMLYQVAGKSEKDKEEGLKFQIKGTGMILKLCNDVMNLEQLIQNGTVMGALTRVLQEEYKKSVELTFNILRIFLAFSNFVEMHGLMSNYRIGLLTMKAIEYEIKRVELRESEAKEREASYEAEIAAAKEAAERSGNNEELKAVVDRVRKSRDKEVNQLKRQQRKQDKMLFVAFYVLLNLAEDVSVERKMVKKNLVDYLACMLDRTYGDLLVLAVSFLKKLSVFEENKDAMKSIFVVSRLTRFIPCSSQPLVVTSLRFLFNLSFDADIREQIMRCGLVPKLIQLLKTASLRGKTLRLLYHLSVDDRCKSMFTYTDGVPLLVGMIVNFPQNLLTKELAALAVNLSLNPRNAEQFVERRGLSHLMDRLATTKDPLLLKIIRNLTQWTYNLQRDCEINDTPYKFRALWPAHIKVFIEICKSTENHDVLVEAVGCLANMTSSDLPANSTWSRLVKENNLLSFFAKLLVPGMAQNDLLLEIVMLIASTCSDPQACELIASTNLITSLYQLWVDKSDDVEILLQLIHCFHKLLLQEASREEAMYNTRVVTNIIDCLNHRNSTVRASADAVTELVLELDRRETGELGPLGMQIRKKRFEGYNQLWLSQMGNMSLQSSMEVHNGGEDSPGVSSMQMMMQMGMMQQPGLTSRAVVGGGGGGGGVGGTGPEPALSGPRSMMMEDHDSMVSVGHGGFDDITDQYDSGLDWRSMMKPQQNSANEAKMKSLDDNFYGSNASYQWGDSPSPDGLDESWDNRFIGK